MADTMEEEIEKRGIDGYQKDMLENGYGLWELTETDGVYRIGRVIDGEIGEELAQSWTKIGALLGALEEGCGVVVDDQTE